MKTKETLRKEHKAELSPAWLLDRIGYSVRGKSGALQRTLTLKAEIFQMYILSVTQVSTCVFSALHFKGTEYFQKMAERLKG